MGCLFVWLSCDLIVGWKSICNDDMYDQMVIQSRTRMRRNLMQFMMNTVRIIYENLILHQQARVYIFHEMERVSNVVGYYQQSRDLLLPLTTSGKLMSSLGYKGR